MTHALRFVPMASTTRPRCGRVCRVRRACPTPSIPWDTNRGLAEAGGIGQSAFLLTEGGFDFRISRLEPNSYDGLLTCNRLTGSPTRFVAFGDPRKRDGPHDCKGREDGAFQAVFPDFAAAVVL
jgi:hypothetical protein